MARSAAVIASVCLAVGVFFALHPNITFADVTEQLNERKAQMLDISSIANTKSQDMVGMAKTFAHGQCNRASIYVHHMSEVMHGTCGRWADIVSSRASTMYSNACVAVRERFGALAEFLKECVQNGINQIRSIGKKVLNNERIKECLVVGSVAVDTWIRIAAEAVEACRAANSGNKLLVGAFLSMCVGLTSLAVTWRSLRCTPVATVPPASAMPVLVLDIPSETAHAVTQALTPLAALGTERRRRADSPTPRLNERDMLDIAVDAAAVVMQAQLVEHKGARASVVRRRRTDSPARLENDENARPMAENGDLLHRLNTFSEYELQCISGLGQKSVQMLIKYRSNQGELQAIDDLVTKVGVRPTVWANFRRAQAF